MAKKDVTIQLTLQEMATQKLKQVQAQVEGVKDSIGKLGTALFLFEGLPGIGNYIANIAGKAKEWGRAVDDIVDLTGATGQEASKLLVIAKSVGVGTEEAASSFAKFGKAVSVAKDDMRKNGDASNSILARLGMTIDDLENNNLYDVFQKVVEKMRDMKDGADKDRVAMELFGRSGWQLHDLLSMTQEDMDKVVKKAEKMGLIISSDLASDWEKFDRQLQNVKGTFGKITISIGNELLPAFQNKLDLLQRLTDKYAVLDTEQRKTVATIIEATIELTAFATAGGIVVKILEMLGVRALAAAGPWGMLAGVIAGATINLAAWKKQFDELSDNDKWDVIMSSSPEAAEAWSKTKANRQYDLLADLKRAEDTNNLPRIKSYYSGRNPVTLRPEIASGGKSADDIAREALHLQDRLANILDSFNDKIIQETGTAFSYNISRLNSEIAKAQRELDEAAAKFAELGINGEQYIAPVQQSLERYREVMSKKYAEDQARALNELKNQTALVNAQLIGDKEAAAEAEYRAALEAIEKERQERWKAAGDEAAANEWAVAKKRDAEQKKLQAVRDARLQEYDLNLQHNSMLAVLEGRTRAEIDNLNRQELEKKIAYMDAELAKATITKDERIRLEREKTDAILQLEDIIGRQREHAVDIALKRLAREYIDWSKEAEQSFKNIDSSFEEHLQKILSGAESFSSGMKGIFQDMVNEITSMLAKMWYEQFLMQPIRQWWSGILGGIFGSGKTTVGMGDFKILERYASGGYYSGGLALVGEEGPELINFDAPGRIFNANETKKILTNNAPKVSVNIINNTGNQIGKPNVDVKWDAQFSEAIINVWLDAYTRDVNGLRTVVEGR